MDDPPVPEGLRRKEMSPWERVRKHMVFKIGEFSG